jgi:hypothetical protein
MGIITYFHGVVLSIKWDNTGKMLRNIHPPRTSVKFHTTG